MRLKSPLPACLMLLALLASPVLAYQQPSPAIREVLDAPALPKLLPSPNKQTLALLEQRRFNSIDELARPTLRLAGLRFDAASNTPTPLLAVQRLRLRTLLNPDAPERVVELPPGGSFHSFAWSPDGQHFLLERRTDSSNELWIGDSTSAKLRIVPGLRLNSLLIQGDYAWLNPRELVVLAQPERRGPAPRLRPQPVVQESSAQPSPERTYPDLLHSPEDEAQFEYHARAQMTVVELPSLIARPIGEPALYSSVSTVGDGQYLLTERLARPFSYQLTWEDFPTIVEVRQRNGRVLRELARMPLRQGVAIDGVLPGPRVFYASPTRDAAIYWVEALDGGNPAMRVAFRDRVMRLDPPYNGAAREVQRMPHRFTRLRFLDDGQHAILTETDRLRAWTRSYLLPLGGEQSRPLFEHSVRERYRHPGNPLMRTLPNGQKVIQTGRDGTAIYMIGQGAGPRGERPFLDRLSLADGTTARLFQSDDRHYEQPLLLLDGSKLLTLRESVSEPPNLMLRDSQQPQLLQALTELKDGSPQLRRLRRELVTFKRSDGVELSFWLYLPPDLRDGERRPTLIWAYPLEFNDAAVAGQLSGSPNRFLTPSGISPQLLALDGYVVLADATMPVVGDPRSINDGFLEQISMNARAIIDKAESLGMVDTRRLAIGGHSYGAFMAANLLGHTDLFKCGIARSGAYNRTLTPFGFQSERRSLWDARETYLKLSPLLFANEIREPLLLIHGEADGNSGTFPLQSERLFQALNGLGGKVRYVLLPHEGHGYSARESVGHTQWEMTQWLRGCLGDPRAASSAAAANRQP